MFLKVSSFFPIIFFSSHESIKGYIRASVGWSVGPSVMLLSAGRDEPANDLFRVYELVFYKHGIFSQAWERDRANY